MFGLSTIGLALHWWLVGSYHTGKFLVSSGISALETTRVVGLTLYEDTTVWLRDVRSVLCGFGDVVHGVLEHLLWTLRSLTTIAGDAVYRLICLVSFLINSVQDLFVSVGSGCWFLISLPHLVVIYTLDALERLFKELGSLSSYSTKRLAECATDPRALQALLGLTVSIGLATALLRNTDLQFRYSTTKAILQRWKRRVWRKAAKLTLKWKRGRTRTTNLGKEALEVCIVCLDSTRSICLLPCRHLCLCAACTKVLPHPLRCPLCRQLVNEAIQIYY